MNAGLAGYQIIPTDERSHRAPVGINNKKIRRELVFGNLCGEDKNRNAARRFWVIWRYFDCGWDANRIAEELSAKGYPSNANAVEQLIHRLGLRAESLAGRQGLVKSAEVVPAPPIQIGTRSGPPEVKVYEGRPAAERLADEPQFYEPTRVKDCAERAERPRSIQDTDIISAYVEDTDDDGIPNVAGLHARRFIEAYGELECAAADPAHHPHKVDTVPSRCVHGVYSPDGTCPSCCSSSLDGLLKVGGRWGWENWISVQPSDRLEKILLRLLRKAWNKRLASLGLPEELAPVSAEKPVSQGQVLTED